MAENHKNPSRNNTQPAPAGAPPKPPAHRLLGCLLTAAALGVAAGLSWYWLAHRPRAHRRPPEPSAILVEVEKIQTGMQRVVVQAMGTVKPARAISLTPRVAGRVVKVSSDFLPGGRFRAGEEIFRIDPEDYMLAVRQQEATTTKLASEIDRYASEVAQRESDITRADSELRIELGQQSVARREYELLGEMVKDEDRELLLRQPELKTAQANCQAARAAKKAAEASMAAARASLNAAEVALQKAKLDLARTVVRAPFDAAVKAKSVDLGSEATSATHAAELVGTDEYWVEVSVPVDQLKWIRAPRNAQEAGSPARICYAAAWGPDAFREANVLRLATELESQGRMARLILSVRDPLCLTPDKAGRPAMILGAYVRAEIQGKDIPDVVRMPRAALRDGNEVWLMAPDNTLEIRKVTLCWSGNDHVYVSAGLRDGDRMIMSDLAAPVQGMALRTARSSQEAVAQPPSQRPLPGSKPEDPQ